MYVKEGKDVDEGEAKMTELARTLTGLPIPQVYHVKQEGDSTFIYLEAMPGELIGWWHLFPLGRAERALRANLVSAVQQLHAVRAPPDARVGGYGRKPLSALLQDAAISASLDSAADLHAWLRASYLRKFPSSSAEYDTEFSPHMDDSAPLVLVHGDLRSMNILVHKNRISGIIDFGRAGWYPEWVEGMAPTMELWKGADLANQRIAEAVLGERFVEQEEYRWIAHARWGWPGQSAPE
ncbi:hypothetical protein JCM10213_003272 [Rhodosporidiobolus nylandii]